MKTSNKIFLGLVSAIALNVLTGMVMLRNSLGPRGIGNGDTVIEGTGPLKKVKLEAVDFSELAIEGNYNVTLSQGEEFVEIEAEENLVDLFQVQKEAGKTLVMTAKDKYTLIPQKGITLHIGFKNLEVINSYGLSKFYAEQELTFNRLEVGLHGAGHIKFPIKADKLDIRLNGASNGELVGVVNKLDLQIAGAGRLSSPELTIKTADVSISGAGHADVHVTDYLDARTYGAGTVQYSGNPKVDQRTAGAGKVYKK